MDRNLESLQEYLDTDIQIKKEWFDNDFLQSVLTQYVTGKELSESQKKGLLNSFVYKMKFDKAQTSYDEKAEPTGSWVGKEKKRYDLILKYVSGHGTQRGFFVHRLVDRNNNKFILFSDNEYMRYQEDNAAAKWFNFTSGDVFKIRATVNRHSLNTSKFNSTGPVRETVLNRPKIGAYIGNKDEPSTEKVVDEA